MRFNIAKTLVCAAALVALSAQAQGPYVGGSIGGTKYKGDDIGGLATDRTSTGGKLYGGYAFNPHIALELGYADLGKFSSPAGSVKGKGVFLDGVGTIPITQSLSALGRVGVFSGKLDTTLAGNDRGTSYKYGAGLQYDFNKQAGIRGEWERYRFKAFNTGTNTDLLSVGLNYKFY